jgi:hypothetical protein
MSAMTPQRITPADKAGAPYRVSRSYPNLSIVCASHTTPPRPGPGKCVRKHLEVDGSVKRVVRA